MPKKSQPKASMQDIVDYLSSQTRPLTKKEICRQFGIKGDDRRQLREALKILKKKNIIEPKGHKFNLINTLSDREIIEITGFDSMGDLIARPYNWTLGSNQPQIIVTSDKLSPPAGIGDVASALIKNQGNQVYHATLIRRITSAHGQMVCFYQEGRVYPVDKHIKQSFELTSVPNTISLQNQDLIIINLPPITARNTEATFVKRIGKIDEAYMPTLISIYMHHLATEFKDSSLKQAEKATIPSLDKNRVDLRSIPFVTIDGSDARDFDDAVWAEPDGQKGWHIMIGIADVAWYVLPETALDSDARLRGNSVYFPDRVLPMLPQSLSNGLCSLMPNQPRAAIVCEAWIDTKGHKIKHTFHRALIQSVRRLTYDEIQSVIDQKSKITGLEIEIQNLIGAYKALMNYRQERHVLEIDVPERQVILNKNGQVKSIQWRTQLPAMQLIEELMILANVSAAETLEEKNALTMYRIHDKPSAEKIESLEQFLSGIGQKAHLSSNPLPEEFNTVLNKIQGTKRARAVNEQVLRTQSQAVYSSENIGHYGLSLSRYAHFTSPIRRYADIMVHRSLIKALKLGKGGLSELEETEFETIADHISHTERQAAAAEMDASDRYLTLFMQDKIGHTFQGRISSITPFGIFITLDNSGAEGFIPFRFITGDFYEYDSDKQMLIGRSTGKKFLIGDTIRVILKECNTVTGSLMFGLLN